MTYFSEQRLLSPPTERAAFSDRQAYVCAELSKLAYFRFEGGHTFDVVLEVAKEFVEDESRWPLLEQRLSALLSGGPADRKRSEEALSEILDAAEFELEGTFSESGTQGFLCTRRVQLAEGSTKNVAYLVFRGTELTDYRDIRADIKASLTRAEVDEEEFEVHTGYWEALRDARSRIVSLLDDAEFDQLFLTGHSLGGAIAVLATRVLKDRVNGACYTFGAPPVGTIEVQNSLKTPVYQLINKTDIVPRLPNPWIAWPIRILLRIFKYLLKMVTVTARLLAASSWDERLEKYIDQMTRYRQTGYVSYLVGDGSSVRLRYNTSVFDRFWWWASMIKKRRWEGAKKLIQEHNIDQYVEKLRIHGLRRQKLDAKGNGDA